MRQAFRKAALVAAMALGTVGIGSGTSRAQNTPATTVSAQPENTTVPTFQDTKLLKEPEVEKAYTTLWEAAQVAASKDGTVLTDSSELRGIVAAAEIISAQSTAKDAHFIAGILIAEPLQDAKSDLPFLRNFDGQTVFYAKVLNSAGETGSYTPDISSLTPDEQTNIETGIVAFAAAELNYLRQEWPKLSQEERDHRSKDMDEQIDRLDEVLPLVHLKEPSVANVFDENYVAWQELRFGLDLLRKPTPPSPKPSQVPK